jgi:hypothetical protein
MLAPSRAGAWLQQSKEWNRGTRCDVVLTVGIISDGGEGKVKFRLGLTVVIMMAVAGCGLVSRPSRGGPSDCSAPAANTQALRSEEHGYCLLYPLGYTTEQPNPQETIISSGSLLDVENPRVFVVVGDANGRAASDLAGGIVAEVQTSLPNWGVRQSTTKFGGETAVVLDNLPGQDIGRQAIVVHNDRTYILTFVPAAPAQSGAYREMEQLYKTVVDSFRFMS